MTTIRLDKPKATAMARNLGDHLRDAHGLDLRHGQAMTALARTLGYNAVQVMNRDLKAAAKTAGSDGDDAAQPPRSITVVTIEHKHGDTVATLPDPETAGRWLAAWCLEYWEREGVHEHDGCEDPTALNDDEIIETYFELVDGEFYHINSFDLGAFDSLDRRPPMNADDFVPTSFGARRRGWAIENGRVVRVGQRFDSDDAAHAYVERLAARYEPKALAALDRLTEGDDETFTGPRYLVTPPGAWWHHQSEDAEAYVRIAFDRRDGRIAAISRGFEGCSTAIASAIRRLSVSDLAGFGLVEADGIPEDLRAPRPAGRYVYTRPDRAWWMYDPDNHLVDVAWLYDREAREIVAWQITTGLQPADPARFVAHLKARLEGPCRAFLEDPDGIGRGWVLDADDLERAQLIDVPR